MPVKRVVKIVILFVLAIAIVIAGIIMFRHLIYNKSVFETDIRVHIPSSASSVIQINRASANNPQFPLQLAPTLNQLEGHFTYPMFIVSGAQGKAVVFKANKEQELAIQDILQKQIYPTFAAKKRNYKGAPLNFYSSDNNNFFACVFHQGLFACGDNYKLLEEIIDTHQKNNFFTDKTFDKLNGKYFDTYNVNVFTKYEKIRTCYNYNKEGDSLELNGYASFANLSAKNKCSQTPDSSLSLAPDLHLLTNDLMACETQKNTYPIWDSLICEFILPMHKLYLSSKPNNSVFAIKFNQSRFRMFDLMQEIEKKASNTKIIEYGRIQRTSYNLYSGSEKFNKKFFNSKQTIYFSFKEKYLIFSTDQKAVEDYLSSSVINSALKDSVSVIPIKQTDDIFYCSIGNSLYNPYFLPLECGFINDSTSLKILQGKYEGELLKLNIKIK